MENLRKLNKSVKEELAHHVLDAIQNGVIDDNNMDDHHYHLFNEDYYIIGHHEAREWFRNHEVDVFEAIGICLEYEKEMFGEVTKQYASAEETVNMLAYILGEELLNDADADNILELQEYMESQVN